MRQFWQSAKTGEIWVIELDEQGHVIGNTGPVYSDPYMRSEEMGEENTEDTLAVRDNEWVEEHRGEFIVFANEDEI
ncbi:MAG: hypothetical protein A2Y12_13500 [Planctomycetes bacterium GWF2_42_9]|nr:MAG: hypothetical protein A2Y12_13500 [Planctomycetes bacterium GWF2_42_9]